MKPATYAVLNLPALQHNLNKVREFAPHAKVMAVIKANAYGHGLLRVAENLQDVDAFAVARVDEAVALRQNGVRIPIILLEGFVCREELDLLINYQISPVVHESVQLQLLSALDKPHCLRVWLKLDTGMNRLGFSDTDFAQAYQCLSDNPAIAQPISIMTHLANADLLNDNKTSHQIKLFNAATGTYQGEKSMSNSAGVIGWSEIDLDWVRPGIMLYGVAPFADQTGRELGLIPVMSLCSRLIAVKQIKAGETVGYGGLWRSDKDRLMGVVAIGYGDGYPRHAPSGTPVLVNGVRVELIGRVSMDMITVDLSACPDAVPGDPVVLWGADLPVEEIASHAGTIPYTLLCGITQRVQIVEEAV